MQNNRNHVLLTVLCVGIILGWFSSMIVLTQFGVNGMWWLVILGGAFLIFYCLNINRKSVTVRTSVDTGKKTLAKRVTDWRKG